MTKETRTIEDYISALLVGIVALVVACLFGSCDVAHAEEVNMEKVMMIESSGNSEAVNRNSGAIGLYQITPICLKDFNMVNKTDYVERDLHNPQVNTRIAYWYLNERIPQLLRHYGIEDDIKARLWAYNAGIRAVRRGVMPKETMEYINKYEKFALQ